jgi:hypothetical protein
MRVENEKKNLSLRRLEFSPETSSKKMPFMNSISIPTTTKSMIFIYTCSMKGTRTEGGTGRQTGSPSDPPPSPPAAILGGGRRPVSSLGHLCLLIIYPSIKDVRAVFLLPPLCLSYVPYISFAFPFFTLNNLLRELIIVSLLSSFSHISFYKSVFYSSIFAC